MIKSISYSQDEIIQWIIDLYCPWGIDLDPTYSKGIFYRNITEPALKFDIAPQTDDTIAAPCTDIPLADNTVMSVMFDPPFTGGSRKNGKPGIIKTRFGFYKSIPALWGMYSLALAEMYRILRRNGILIFKCQDSIESGKQYFSEWYILKEAMKIGFYPRDKFILLAKSRLVSPNQKKQQHCRKFHCYFLVLEKVKSRVNYK